uniref:Retinoblastoma-like 2 (p130) n=1 Tax=Esox lucius TaxID=8010 RepID=A0A3P8YQL2_ESOLU
TTGWSCFNITRLGFDDLCRDLNMDEQASNEAWKSYENISKNYTLEGSELPWLACALYVACRTAVPTVGKGTADGNYVSLTRILRRSEQSLIEFFSKMKKWQDMANLSQDFRQSTEKLERNFTVSAVIFKKYVPIFKAIFKAPSDEPPRVHRSRKQRRHPCTVTEVLKFCWILFVHAKGNFPMISDDLVNSYHLLLCALDLVFANALLCNTRKDLLNPSFKGLPEDFSSKDYKPMAGPCCFIEQLCGLHDGLVLEAKGVKEHFWKPFIKRLFHKKILKGKEDSLTGFLDPVNFGDSFSSLGRVYEEHVLATGGLDERIFLGEGANEHIGMPGPCLCEGVENQVTPVYRLYSSLMARHTLSTPLTGRKYVPDRSLGSPVSTAMQSVGRLHSLLAGLKHGPSGRLKDLFRSCARDPSEAISTRLTEMCQLFGHRYDGSREDRSGMGKDIAVKYFRLAEALYYKTLETIMDQEKKRLGDMDLSSILEQDLFQRSLLVCCLEIVIFSYRPPGDFPRVIQIFQLPAYHFYKVIEVLVRAEQGLFREVVKHLNQIEEQVLESLAWEGGSPLWDSIRGAKNQAPACQEVMPPHQFVCTWCNDSLKFPPPGLSPPPPTLLDCYSSPPTGSARRRLFLDSSSDTPSDPSATTPATTATTAVRTSQAIVTATIPAGQTVVTMATATVTANNGQTVTIPVQGIANENGGITFIPVQVSVTGQGTATLQPLTGSMTSQPQTTTTLNSSAPQGSPAASKPIKTPAVQKPSNNKPQKMGSHSLFFRKVYHLASVRLRDLCAKLDISSELRRKIWTCFEYSLVHCSELMMDRHIDQLLMCAVYVMTKVTKADKSFQNIMRCYRSQPQASSSVYRNVLISGRKRRHSGSSGGNRQSSDTNHELGRNAPAFSAEEEQRGDLIHFYNRVYIKEMRHFALRYSTSSLLEGVESPPLCPYPSMRTSFPRRVLLSHNHSIYISPHKTNPPTPTAQDTLFYYICSSPAHRLAEINTMIRTGDTPTKKRSMQLEEEPSPKRVCPSNQSALLRRLQDVANDRSFSH